MGDDYFATEQGQIIAGAHKYLSAARLLRESYDFEDRPMLLYTPILHLAAHGVELLLKFPLLANSSIASVKSCYGHDLMKLWSADGNNRLREVVLQAADEKWEMARVSGRWTLDDFSSDPRDELVAGLNQLSWLHGRASDFALRYTVAAGTRAPRPAFLVEAFGYVAERCAMSRSYLDPQK